MRIRIRTFAAIVGDLYIARSPIMETGFSRLSPPLSKDASHDSQETVKCSGAQDHSD